MIFSAVPGVYKHVIKAVFGSCKNVRGGCSSKELKDHKILEIVYVHPLKSSNV
jgi:hypothetical protein